MEEDEKHGQGRDHLQLQKLGETHKASNPIRKIRALKKMMMMMLMMKKLMFSLTSSSPDFTILIK